MRLMIVALDIAVRELTKVEVKTTTIRHVPKVDAPQKAKPLYEATFTSLNLLDEILSVNSLFCRRSRQ